MFGTFRKHSQPLWIAIIIVVVISFVVFFTPNFDPFDTGGTITADAAAVKQAQSHIILEEVIRPSMVQGLARGGRFQEAMQMVGGNQREAMQMVFQLMQPQAPSVLNTANANRIAGNSRHIDLDGDDFGDINSLEYRARIRLRKLALAQGLGIMISDTAVNAARNFMVQNLNGTQEYNANHYDQLMKQLANGGFIASGRTGREQFDDYLRNRLTLMQLTVLMTRSAGFWPDADTAKLYARQNREYAVEAAFISLTNHTATATNYADLIKADGFTNHFNKVANQYQVPVHHTIAFVKIELADFEGDIRKELKFDDEVQKLVERHNTTTNRFTETNGTALPINATNLLARAEAEVRNTPIGDKMFEISNAAARTQALAFRKALFNQPPYATARLEATAKQFELQLHTATFSRENPPEDLPGALIEAAFAPSLKSGKLLESAVFTINPNHIYILGLQSITPRKLRQYAELTEDEQNEVHESFLTSETRRLALEAGEKFQAVAEASLKEGRTFAHTATNAGLSMVTLPPFSLYNAASTNHIDLLKNLVPLSTLQNAVLIHEQKQQSKSDSEKENLSAFLENIDGGVSFNESIAGYVLNITERINPSVPDAKALSEFAATSRRNTRAQAAGNDWFIGHQRQLDAEITISSLENRRAGLPSEINEVNESILFKEQKLAGQLAASLKQSGITDTKITAPLEHWTEAQTGTLKKLVHAHYFDKPPKHPNAAKIIVPLLSGRLREPWADLDEKMADLHKLKSLQATGIDEAIANAQQLVK